MKEQQLIDKSSMKEQELIEEKLMKEQQEEALNINKITPSSPSLTTLSFIDNKLDDNFKEYSLNKVDSLSTNGEGDGDDNGNGDDDGMNEINEK